MQITVIHNGPSNQSASSLHTVLAEEPAATIILDGIMHAGPFPEESNNTLVALSKEWESKSPLPRNRTIFYKNKLPLLQPSSVPSAQCPWHIISDGKYVTDIDPNWLLRILDDVQTQVIALNVDPELTAFREKIRITSQNNIAGFRRLYTDTARYTPVKTDWPHHLFIKADIFRELTQEGSLPLGFSEVLARCREKSITYRSVSLAGTVLDLTTEADLLTFLYRRINSIWPSHTRGYMTLSDTNNTELSHNVRLMGKVIVGQNVRIHQGATVIGPTIIGDNVEIQQDALVKAAVVGTGQTVSQGRYIQHRILTNNIRVNNEDSTLQTENKIFPFHQQKVWAFSFGNYRDRNFHKWPTLSYSGCFKRIFDIAAALTLLILFAPIMPILALAIKLTSPGPIFFKDKRQGLYGREFDCLKFRTMITGAEDIQNILRQISQVDGPQFKMEDDPRVSTVGKFLRETCLDEIPQFINVLWGQMSLVGPRPSPVSENSLCPPWRDARLSVRPGITGLWQICRTRREGQDFQEWIYFDTKYVKNLSFKLDLWICWQTAKKLVIEFLRRF